MKTNIYKYLCVSIVMYIVCSLQTVGAQTSPPKGTKQQTQVADTIPQTGDEQEKKTKWKLILLIFANFL